jgi:hypothetical protein
MKMIVAAFLGLFAAPALAQPSPAAAAPDYSSPTAWLCLPGRADDACGRPLATADLNPDGYGPVRQAAPAADPPIDCFYIYPTVSRDPGMNSDMDPGTEERGAATVQFARFASLCRPYAPVYRQATMASIGAVMSGTDPAPIFRLAYGDVLAAWHYYLDHYNAGRPFVLIGHSQGSIHAIRLIQQEIEGRPIAARMVSAIIAGFNVEVPIGGDVGGTFRQTPLCTRAGQTGCVMTWESFRASAPPTGPGLFAYAAHPGMTVGCTNPAALGSDARVPLDSDWIALPAAAPGIVWSSAGPPPAPFLHTEGLVSGQCVHDGPIGYFSIEVNADPADARTDRIPGDVPLPGWGIHPVDLNIAQGDVLRAVAAQSAAFLAGNR